MALQLVYQSSIRDPFCFAKRFASKHAKHRFKAQLLRQLRHRKPSVSRQPHSPLE